MPKVGIFTRYHHYYGGVESITSLLSRILINQGYTVEVIAGDQFPLSPNEKRAASIFGEPFVFRKYFRKKVNDFDLIICNGEFGFGLQHPRSINLFHGSAYGYRKAVKGHLGPRSSLILYRNEMFQKWAANGKIVVCVSNYLRELFEKQGVNVAHVIENGIDLNVFKKQLNVEKRDKYLFVGSLDYIGKGFDILDQLALNGIRIDCVTQKKPSENLGWVKQVPNHEMPNIYSKYKLLLFPSRFEGLSVAPLEAMACGLPVVISPVGLGPKLKHWIPEFVADSFEPAEYLEKAKNIEQNYIEFSEKAITYVQEHHSLCRFEEKWKRLINNTLDIK